MTNNGRILACNCVFWVLPYKVLIMRRKLLVSKEKLDPRYREVFSHLSRRMDVPLEVLMKLEAIGSFKLTPIVDFVLDDAFFEDIKHGKGSLEERLQRVGKAFGFPGTRVIAAIKRMGHRLPTTGNQTRIF